MQRLMAELPTKLSWVKNLAEMETWQDYMVTTEAWKTWSSVAQESFVVTNRFTVDWLAVYDHNYTLEDFD